MSMLVKVVIPKVAAYWDRLAYCLDFKIAKVDIIKKKYLNDPEECCKEMFVQWLSTKENIDAKTWGVLLKTLRDIDLIAVAEQIETELNANLKVNSDPPLRKPWFCPLQ